MFIEKQEDPTITPGAQGKFVVFEGPDGAGKDTIMDLVACTLGGKHPEAVILRTCEPWKPSIKKVWLTESHSTSATALAMFADRHDHATNYLIPAINEGKLILCSRYTMSTWVYNVFYGKCAPYVQTIVEQAQNALIKPDLYVVVTAPTSLLYERTRNKREGATSRDDSDFTWDMLDTLRKGYDRASADAFKQGIEVVNVVNEYPMDHPNTISYIKQVVWAIENMYEFTD